MRATNSCLEFKLHRSPRLLLRPRVFNLTACYIYIYVSNRNNPSCYRSGRGGAEILRERSRSTVERGKSAMERRKRVEMRLLQWLPLPSIFVLSSVMRRLYREGAKARQKKEGVHEEENRHGGEQRSRICI